MQFFNRTTQEFASTPGMIDDAVVISDYWVNHALNVIEKSYGHRCSVFDKGKDLFKFGRSVFNDTTKATLMTLPDNVFNEVYVDSNDITHLVSNTTTTSQHVRVEGHIVNSGGGLTFVVQSLQLTGQTMVALDTPLARCTRIYNNDLTEFGAGNVVFACSSVATTGGVPDVSSHVHCMVASGEQQSEKASTTISNSDYWIVTGAYASVLQKSGSPLIDAELEQRRVEPGLGKKVFRKSFDLGISNTGGKFEYFHGPYYIVRNNSDIRIRFKASAADTEVSGGMYGVLAKIVGDV